MQKSLAALQRKLVRIDTDLTESVGLVLRTLHAT
jgi:hypothetical protein